MYKNKNKSLFFHIIGIFLLLSSNTGMAMQNTGAQAPTGPAKKPVAEMNEDEAKTYLTELLADQTNQAKEFSVLQTNFADAQKVAQEAQQKLKFLQENPTTSVGKAEFVNCPESIAKKWGEKLEAEKVLIEYQKGGWAKASHVADQVFWPILKDQGIILAGELRRKKYKTKIEEQNEEMGILNKKNTKKQFKINQEDLAAKRAAVAYNKRNQEGLELLQDAQTLGQILVNLDTIDKTTHNVEKRTAVMKAQLLDIQESQVKALHTRTMNQKPIPPTKPAPAPKDKKNKE